MLRNLGLLAFIFGGQKGRRNRLLTILSAPEEEEEEETPPTDWIK